MTESFEDAIKALRHIARGNGSVLRIADRIVAAHERETKAEGVCGPITGELRAAMRQWGWVESDGSITFATSPLPPSIDAEQSLAISGSDFDRYCDAIDSIHAHLERENADLRVKFVNTNRHAQHVERENVSLKAELELDRVLREQEDRNGWIELPADADGEPIRLGDELVDISDMSHCGKAHIIELKEDGWIVFVGSLGRWPHVYRHVKPDTWECILADALGCEPYEVEGDDDLMALVARCKALAGDAE